MKVTSIVILTKNAGRRFENLLTNLKSQSYQDFEIVVVDSGSTDNTLEFARKYGCKIHQIKPDEFHHSRTRNLGAELATGDYLVFITQDVMPLDDQFLEIIINNLQGEKVAGVYGRQIAYPDANPIEKFFYEYFYPSERKTITFKDVEKLSEFYVSNVFISDVCSAIKKDVWEKYKFDERIIMAEDKKWAIDVLKAGFELIYEPKIKVYHSHRYSLISGFKRRFDDGVAMRQICDSGSVASRGFSYLINEMKYLSKNYSQWVPYALVYDFVRFTGFALGKNYGYVPNVLRKKISKHSGWWNVAKEN